MLILLTGATGYIGGHILSQLLSAHHTVRAIVRKGRSNYLRSAFPDEAALEIVEIEEGLKDAKWDDYMKDGVEALVHVAAPAFLKGLSNKEIFEEGYGGTINIVNAALRAGTVQRIVVTGSVVSLFDADFSQGYAPNPLSQTSYGSFDISTFDFDAEGTGPAIAYQAAKTIADKRIWQLAQEHPNVYFSVPIVPTVWGPFVSDPGEKSSLSTLQLIYALFDNNKERTYPPLVSFIGWAHMADVRDVATAHVLSLTAPPAPNNMNRFLISAHMFSWRDIVLLIKREFPELEERLPSDDAPAPTNQMTAKYETTLTEEVLGLNHYIPWEQTILESVRECLRLE